MGRNLHVTKQLIEAVIFDAGGVLLHPNFDWLIAETAKLGLGLRLHELHRAYYAMIYAVDVDERGAREGIAVADDQVRLFLAIHLLRGCDVDRETVERVAPVLAGAAKRDFPRESDIFHWAMPGMRDSLEQLRDMGFLLGVASNNDGALQAQLSAVGIDDIFAVALDSGVEGVAKPDPELLLRAARRLEVAPERCLYIGDIDRVDGAAARAAGMHFALLDPLGQARSSAPLTIAKLTDVFEHFTRSG